ncbi:MAG: hypothetical protein U0X92_12795 [Anaerolineales bacterium]
MDTASVRILHTDANEHVHVATNLTGLHESPTFRVPLVSELTFGTELEVLDEQGSGSLSAKRTDIWAGHIAPTSARTRTRLRQLIS